VEGVISDDHSYSDFTTVPEPSAALLALTGLAWLAAAGSRAVG